ncbi:hypothetical protein [Anaerotruncus massiliensis (ex Liu et al. 2021)]|uniref:hypothetical protein n=2 Tax=Anaerotruncus TaxID=244127 RepID=UPI00208CDFAD|nr:hypothetical protein [uncultured Anaerotruncus sp.]GKH45832.1 hypothetical protein CE91St45_03940 [Oscillospiraceae bacterium]
MLHVKNGVPVLALICLLGACAAPADGPQAEPPFASGSSLEATAPESASPAVPAEKAPPKGGAKVEWPTLEESMAAYAEVLNGSRNARSDEGEIPFEDLFNRTEDGEFYEWEKYAFFDMNGDGIPELHLSTGHGNSYEIYTYYNQEVMLWYRGVDYNYPLENRAMGYIRYGAAPTHMDYQYRVLDFWGDTQFYIEFTKGDTDENGIYDERDDYIYKGKWISKEEWDKLTEPYLAVKPADLCWKPMRNDTP